MALYAGISGVEESEHCNCSSISTGGVVPDHEVVRNNTARQHGSAFAVNDDASAEQPGSGPTRTVVVDVGVSQCNAGNHDGVVVP